MTDTVVVKAGAQNTGADNTLYPRLRLLAGSTLASRAPSDVSVA